MKENEKGRFCMDHPIIGWIDFWWFPEDDFRPNERKGFWQITGHFMPGDKKNFDIYWYANDIGEYFAKLKVYYGNEIREYKKFEFLISNSIESEDIFEIKDLRTYDNYIIFDVKSKEEVKDVIITPNRYTSGWIFEQKKIDKINKDGSKLVILPYYPTLWTPANVTLAIASNNGKYYSEKTIEMKKNEGLVWLFFYIVDGLRISFFK